MSKPLRFFLLLGVIVCFLNAFANYQENDIPTAVGLVLVAIVLWVIARIPNKKNL